MKTFPPKKCGDWCKNCGIIHEPDGGFPIPRIMVKFDGTEWTIYEPGDEPLIPEKEELKEELKEESKEEPKEE